MTNKRTGNGKGNSTTTATAPAPQQQQQIPFGDDNKKGNRKGNSKSNGNPSFAMKLQRMGHPADEVVNFYFRTVGVEGP